LERWANQIYTRVAVILPKVRDPRLITIRRGGTLTDADHRLLAAWAAACAEHALPNVIHPRFERAWQRGPKDFRGRCRIGASLFVVAVRLVGTPRPTTRRTDQCSEPGWTRSRSTRSQYSPCSARRIQRWRRAARRRIRAWLRSSSI